MHSKKGSLSKVTGSLQKKNNSRNYYAVIRYPDSNGKIVQKWVSTRTSRKTDASKFLVDRINEIEKELYSENEPARIKLIDLLENWRAAYEKLEATTQEGYEMNFDNHILPYFRKKDLWTHEVKRRHIQEYIEFEGQNGRLLGEGGLKKESVKKYISNLSIVFENAILNEYIDTNPCDRVKYPLSIFDEEPYEAKFLCLEDMLRFMKIILDKKIMEKPDDDHYWGFITGMVFASFYALRRGEIYGLKWSNIDMDNDLVYIKKTWVVQKKYHEKGPKNRASKVAMPLMPEVKNYLYKLQEHQCKCKQFYGSAYADTNLLVTKDCGERFGIHYLNKRLQKTLNNNGLPIVCLHQLRHSTATLLRTLGYSVQEIQSWLRHSDIKSTMRYAHDNLELKKKAAETINSLFSFD